MIKQIREKMLAWLGALALLGAPMVTLVACEQPGQGGGEQRAEQQGTSPGQGGMEQGRQQGGEQQAVSPTGGRASQGGAGQGGAQAGAGGGAGGA